MDFNETFDCFYKELLNGMQLKSSFKFLEISL